MWIPHPIPPRYINPVMLKGYLKVVKMAVPAKSIFEFNYYYFKYKDYTLYYSPVNKITTEY